MSILGEALNYIVATTTGFRAPVTASTDVPIYLNRMPPEVEHTAIALYEPGGAPPVSGLADTIPLVERPRIQVISRAPRYDTARSNIQRIWDSFHALIEYDVPKESPSTGTTRWHTADPVNSPADIGRDANERDQVTADFQIVKEVS